MRIAIVHHWFVTRGGGERVAEVLAGMFPGADLFTLLADHNQFPQGVAGRKLRTSFLQRIPGATASTVICCRSIPQPWKSSISLLTTSC